VLSSKLSKWYELLLGCLVVTPGDEVRYLGSGQRVAGWSTLSR
jgi:hypothetical protein